jgi:L-arabinose isomerase
VRSADLPDLATATEAWMLAGGAHHSVLGYAVTAEEMRDWAEIMGVESVHIGKHTEIVALRRELALDDILWKNR